MADSAGRLKVLSVVGAGRSGTTVLASILGEIDGFASAGELRWLWERGVVAQRPCGCGEIPTRCPVWSPIITKTLGTSDPESQVDLARQLMASQAVLAQRRNLLRVLRSADGGQRQWAALQDVRASTAAAAAAFAEETSARVVVETSKRPLDAAIFAALDNVEHFVLHLVRDPRAVVHSWRRAKEFSVAGQTRSIGTRSLPSTVRRWISNCLSAEFLRRQLPDSRWLHMRYEDFAQHPREAVSEILALLGESGEAPFESDDTVLLRSNHIVAGNPSRFTTGSVKIRADQEWQDQMARVDQRLVELATMPLLMRYGYAAWPRVPLRHRDAA
jgi:hypothetical protein